MSMIFPGMDPYLEDAWEAFQGPFVTALADTLQPLLRPRYYPVVGQRTFGEPGRGIAPAAEVVQPYLEIFDRRDSQPVVAALEVVSPINKAAGPGRLAYLARQGEIRQGKAHLVEIDLLRQGPHLLAVPLEEAERLGAFTYLVSVNRTGGPRAGFDVYRIPLRQRLPRVAVPLARGDADVVIDLQAVLATTYERGDFRWRLPYDRPCVPPLEPEDQAWADALIRQAPAPMFRR
jgi:hypothetical protein